MRPNDNRPIFRPASLAVTAAMLFVLSAGLFAGRAHAASREYFTDEEVDYLRDAQGLPQRVTALLRLADYRLVTLYIKEKSKEDRELEKRIAELHDEIAGRPPAITEQKPGTKPSAPAVDNGRPYLNDLTRAELLRGYIEALEEIQNDIDNAYRDKQDVRGPLEQFEKFLRESNPRLRGFQSKNDTEFQAILDAKSTTQEALDDAQDALKKVPKTEKSGRQ
jgi:hypothetical protein